VSNKTWRYDTVSNSWTRLADIPAGGDGPTATCYNGKIYVMGGNGSNQFHIYDVGTDAWTSGPALPRGVAGAAAAAWDGKVYLVGGDDDFAPSTGVSDRVDVYDIAASAWLGTATPLPVATTNAGFVQVGADLYLAGGWNELSPDANVSAVQRYNLVADAWELGPALGSPRADLALAATGQALYAIAGDQNGGWFFEPTKLVERLDLGAWPAGAWADLDDPLPIQLTALSAGFCTRALLDSSVAEVWSVGGLDPFWFIIGRTFFREASSEDCYSIYGDVPWLLVTPAVGEVSPGGSLPIVVTFDASTLAPGEYSATLVVQSNDAGSYLMRIPVTLNVKALRVYYLPVVFKGDRP
jgi:hypothetical protein